MRTLASRIRRLHIRIFVLQDRLERAKTQMQVLNIRVAMQTAYRQMIALANEVDLEKDPPGEAK